MQKPSIAKGTRDFTPEVMLKREYIFDTIRQVFRLYGFVPIETPAMENLSTLLGKYGEEGDKLLFRILNSGDFLSGVNQELISEKDSSKIASEICERGLRYDLTVPFARFVVMHQNKIQFPFKRYQIQPVWRADRPQKGRYREFYQCDADVVGSDSLLNEVELLRIVDEVFQRLGINVLIKLNNRKLLAGIAEYIGEPERITDITVAIDKLDKIGEEKVIAEMLDKGISASSADKLKPFFGIKGTLSERLSEMKSRLAGFEIAEKGISEMEELFHYIENSELKSEIELDLTLARGLNYYTGAIIEVKAKDVEIGSICGGGRYDNLTGIFGMPGVSGVGISFGADRIFDVLNQLENFPEDQTTAKGVMFCNFGTSESVYSLKIMHELRREAIPSEIYPDQAKMKKQLAFADKKGYRYVAMVGENEMKEGKVTLKDMVKSEQFLVDIKQMIEKVKEQLD